MEHYEVRVASLARTQASKLAPTARHGKHMRGTCKQVCAHSDSLPAALRTTWTTRAIQRVPSQGAAHGAVVMTSCQQRSKGRPCLVILLGMLASFGYFGPSCPVWVMWRASFGYFGPSCPVWVMLRASFGYFGPSCPVWVMLRVWSHFGVSCPSLVILGRLVHFVSLLARFAVSFWLFSNIRSTVRQDIEISVPCVQLF
jgi:hypothetical protein